MRIFIAIDIPNDIKEKIHSYYKEIKGVEGKFVEKENIHVTLKFLGEIQPNIVDKIKEELNKIKFQKFFLEIRGFGSFNNRVLWFGIGKGKENLLYLKKEIDRVLKNLGFAEDLDYFPHITILRIKKIVSRSIYKEIFEKLRDIKIGEFMVDSFSLKQSILRSQGPLYLDIEKYKLI